MLFVQLTGPSRPFPFRCLSAHVPQSCKSLQDNKPGQSQRHNHQCKHTGAERKQDQATSSQGESNAERSAMPAWTLRECKRRMVLSLCVYPPIPSHPIHVFISFLQPPYRWPGCRPEQRADGQQSARARQGGRSCQTWQTTTSPNSPSQTMANCAVSGLGCGAGKQRVRYVNAYVFSVQWVCWWCFILQRQRVCVVS